MTKIAFQAGDHSSALSTYKELLGYTKSAVTRNYSEKSINGILDYVGAAGANPSAGSVGEVDLEFMQAFYAATKEALVEAKNEVCPVSHATFHQN